MSLTEKLLQYANHNLNVMLIGAHGIGKSTVVKAVAEQLGLNFKYYSSSTLDPFAELIGIPVPQEDKTIEFYRPNDLEDAEFVFFDELNRAHPRVLNTVLEIIQFKSINGIPLKNLKMVWAAINPPGSDYQVEDLDPALQDRFHCYIKMQPMISLNYMQDKMPRDLARCLKTWWTEDLSEDQRAILTPRRIEYIGTMIDKGIPFRDALPQGHKFPVPNLEKKLKALKNPEEVFLLNRDNILNKTDVVLERIKKDKKLSIKVCQVMKKFSESDLFTCRDILEEMPQELINQVGDRRFIVKRKRFHAMFTQGGVKIDAYPKVAKAFKFEQIEG